MKSIFRIALACVLCICIAISIPASAQLSDEASYKAWLGASDMKTTSELWDKVVAEKQSAFDKNNANPALRFNLALAQYGLLGGTMRAHDEDRFNEYYEKTESNLKALSKDDKYKGDAKALLGAIYGLKIAYSSMSGMVLGPKSNSAIKDAIEFAPESPLVWRIEANSKLYTPSMFGGNKDEAIKAFEKCISLFESKPELLKYNWVYLDAHVFLGQAYLSQGQTAKAIEIYEKALKLEPNLAWVKYDLLPRAQKKALSK